MTKRARYYKTDSGLKLALGNLKIGEDTLILNLGPAYNCPSDRLGKCTCSAICYAKRAEIQYPKTKAYRRAQQQYWLTTSADDILFDIISVLYKNKYYKKGRLSYLVNKIKYLRVNESGDFWSQKCVNKLDHIAITLKAHGITTYTYTARDDLHYEYANFLVKGSEHFRGNNGACIAREQKTIDEATPYGGPIYNETISGKDRWFAICPGNCSKCDFCKVKNNLNIVFPIH